MDVVIVKVCTLFVHFSHNAGCAQVMLQALIKPSALCGESTMFDHCLQHHCEHPTVWL